MVQALAADAAALQAGVVAGKDTHTLRAEVLRLRGRYTQVETILDFYGDAVNTRTNPAARGGASRPRRDRRRQPRRGAQASRPRIAPRARLPRQGVGRFDPPRGCSPVGPSANPSPATAVKLTRHNLGHPTALLHEVGHQAAHQTGWTGELSSALESVLSRRSRELGVVWGRGRARSLPTCSHSRSADGRHWRRARERRRRDHAGGVPRAPGRSASVSLGTGRLQRHAVPVVVRPRPVGHRRRGLAPPTPSRIGTRRWRRHRTRHPRVTGWARRRVHAAPVQDVLGQPIPGSDPRLRPTWRTFVSIAGDSLDTSHYLARAESRSRLHLARHPSEHRSLEHRSSPCAPFVVG